MSHWLYKVVELLEAETSDLRELAKIAGADHTTFYRGADLSGADLSGQDLRGMEFAGADLRDVVVDEKTRMEPQTSEDILIVQDGDDYIEGFPASGDVLEDFDPGGMKRPIDLNGSYFPEPPEGPIEFRDIDEPWCPKMIVVLPGDFLMGSPPSDDEAYNNERPQREVTIKQAFALGKHPVTFEEYDHFATSTERGKPDDQSWGRGRRPVINVSWDDAVAYCKWLSDRTKQEYRLPSEAEWEYACRAGTNTVYWWGERWDPSKANANWPDGKTTEVNDTLDNKWNLHGMLGNVWEWNEDVWHGSYKEAPYDNRAWSFDGDPAVRVLRGGCWQGPPSGVRSAHRGKGAATGRDEKTGFRVARTIKAGELIFGKSVSPMPSEVGEDEDYELIPWTDEGWERIKRYHGSISISGSDYEGQDVLSVDGWEHQRTKKNGDRGSIDIGGYPNVIVEYIRRVDREEPWDHFSKHYYSWILVRENGVVYCSLRSRVSTK